MTTGVLIVLCGLPASGKSTVAARLRADRGALVVSADSVRTEGADPVHVFDRMHKDAEAALSVGRGVVVVDACSLRPFERARWLAIGRRTDARCELWIVATPWRLCHARDRGRARPSSIDWLDGARLVRAAEGFSGKGGAYREGWDVVHYMGGEGP